MTQREFRFIGKDGSMGLRFGKYYVLDVHAVGNLKRLILKWTIEVEVWGKNNKKIFVPYTNIETFLANWK